MHEHRCSLAHLYLWSKSFRSFKQQSVVLVLNQFIYAKGGRQHSSRHRVSRYQFPTQSHQLNFNSHSIYTLLYSYLHLAVIHYSRMDRSTHMNICTILLFIIHTHTYVQAREGARSGRKDRGRGRWGGRGRRVREGKDEEGREKDISTHVARKVRDKHGNWTHTHQ